MALIEASLSRLSKFDLICLALDYQQKQDIGFDNITEELTELCKSCTKLELDVAITNAVNNSSKNQIVMLEGHC